MHEDWSSLDVPSSSVRLSTRSGLHVCVKQTEVDARSRRTRGLSDGPADVGIQK